MITICDLSIAWHLASLVNSSFELSPRLKEYYNNLRSFDMEGFDESIRNFLMEIKNDTITTSKN